jgi:hypothetical protein
LIITSVGAVEMGTTNVAVEMQWLSVSNRLHAIGRTTNVTERFASNLVVRFIPANPPTNAFLDRIGLTNLTPYFYRVLLEDAGPGDPCAP